MKSAQNESTHQRGLALPIQTIETSAHYGATLTCLDYFGSFISEVQVR